MQSSIILFNKQTSRTYSQMSEQNNKPQVKETLVNTEIMTEKQIELGDRIRKFIC